MKTNSSIILILKNNQVLFLKYKRNLKLLVTLML